MPYFQTLYSGSSGNCTLLSGGGKSVLVDMGKSCRAAVTALAEASLTPDDIGAILITHEHSDHISALNVFLKHFKIPFYGPEASLRYLTRNMLIPMDTLLYPIREGESCEVCGFGVTPFRTDHDSEDCFGYRIEFKNGDVAAIATDLGRMTDEVFDKLIDCSIVALESNYDEGMLRFGRYPIYLKRRIASDRGHLSNLDCAETLSRLAARGAKRFSLMHLSEENNSPDVALTTALGIFENSTLPTDGIEIAPRHIPGRRLEIG